MPATHRFRPHLKRLESRSNPAGTVTGSLIGGTWSLVGDANPNSIVINPTAIAGDFVLTGVGTNVAGITSPSGVKNIIVRLGGGADSVVINNTGVERALAGGISIDGGTEANSVTISKMSIAGNIIVNNHANAAGTDFFALRDSRVTGAVRINNRDGNSITEFIRTTPGVSAIGRGVTINNGVGDDRVTFRDTHVAGNISVNNGLPNATNSAGQFRIFNEENTDARSMILGNVSVQYRSGVVDYDGIWDSEVRGNVSFLRGAGGGEVYFDGNKIAQPILVHGNVSISGKTKTDLLIGVSNLKTGLHVGRNLSILTDVGVDELDISRLTVGGSTRINTGGGIDTIRIDDSTFHDVNIMTGAGNDQVVIENVSGTNVATQFAGTLRIDLGDDNDTLTFGAAADGKRQVQLFRKTTLLGGNGADTFNRLNLKSFFVEPFISFESVV